MGASTICLRPPHLNSGSSRLISHVRGEAPQVLFFKNHMFNAEKLLKEFD